MGPGISRAEFTIANAVKKAANSSSLNAHAGAGAGTSAGYITQHVGKWHLGDFWNKKNPAVPTGTLLNRRTVDCGGMGQRQHTHC